MFVFVLVVVVASDAITITKWVVRTITIWRATCECGASLLPSIVPALRQIEHLFLVVIVGNMVHLHRVIANQASDIL